ncbi:MAG: GGDEF domain-containing protein [Oricola sp.]|nr:GGDEF domain-containing protein [Oricola sp.]
MLTGLPNRPAFMEMIGEREPASLALIEIDRLKSVNDLYGQAEGDDLLRAVSTFMAQTIGPRDILARWSGAEFILYLEEDDPDRARDTLETLREAVAASTGISQHRVTFSAGLVAMSGDIDLDSAAAEELLHAAKNTGRNSVMTPMLAIDGGAGQLRELSESFDTDMLLSGT